MHSGGLSQTVANRPKAVIRRVYKRGNSIDEVDFAIR